MAYILNEDGFRDRMHGRQPSTVVDAPPPVEPVPEDGPPPAAEGRPSVARTSLGRTSLGRTSAGGGRPNIGRNSVQVRALSFQRSLLWEGNAHERFCGFQIFPL